MESAAYIGPSIRIKGEVTAREPLAIAGHVDGTIDADGHSVTIDAGGCLMATVTAQTIVVGGCVVGQLTAGERVVIRATAEVEGDISAPSVSLADGAVLRGRIETAERKPALQLAS
jgi:cytoskeletal protein CcmA (bactofilin family)